ncbi:protein RALF-like 24 [Actinidia eriantha]|uniref:protein RALF-like 24 n=1 Tax=Actinidia eriantha TaxID=165200 RepID=UPI002585B8F1|nr:protein RALF-like 24 [Actinidia eriantha]
MHTTQLKPMSTLFIVLLFLHTHLKICNGVSVLGLNSLKTSEIDPTAGRVCDGEIGECTAEMDSESNRRVLVMNRGFISYETLKRDLVPCTRRGASYYNCRAAGEANPYHRGCEAITACARDISDIKT